MGLGDVWFQNDNVRKHVLCEFVLRNNISKLRCLKDLNRRVGVYS